MSFPIEASVEQEAQGLLSAKTNDHVSAINVPRGETSMIQQRCPEGKDQTKAGQNTLI